MRLRHVFHFHHKNLVEPLFAPNRAKRRREIRELKPRSERATRLRRFQYVRGQLPAPIVRAAQAIAKTEAAFDKVYHTKNEAVFAKAEAAYDNAHYAYLFVLQIHMPAILALHAKECLNCPWDGTTLFPAKPTRSRRRKT